MKRIGNIYSEICSIHNLQVADMLASKGKTKQQGVIEHRKNQDANIAALHEMLVNKTYKTSGYTTFSIYEPKEREVYMLPYFPDRIAHHAIMVILEPILTRMFTADTYSCVTGRGVHGAANAVKRALMDKARTHYCVKLDIKKFYQSIDHDVLKMTLTRKFKDKDLLWLLFEIIDSADGLPIGNYLSQFLSNLYLTHFDHWLKEVKKVEYYFRYADDIVILADNKPYLHTLRAEIAKYFATNLKLTVKDNYQVFPVAARGIDFVGYVFYHTHTRMRKTIKQSFARAVATKKSKATIASYMGWARHCNAKNLIKKLIHEPL